MITVDPEVLRGYRLQGAIVDSILDGNRSEPIESEVWRAMDRASYWLLWHENRSKGGKSWPIEPDPIDEDEWRYLGAPEDNDGRPTTNQLA